MRELYADMPGWKGMLDGTAVWYDNGRCIEASGIQFYAKMPENEWEEWITKFKGFIDAATQKNLRFAEG